MGSPLAKDRWASQQDIGGLLVPTHIRRNFPESATILDVGAGWGKYRYLLPTHPMDACEIWPEYAPSLQPLYNQVFMTDIRTFNYDFYDIIIFGDVLEHLTQTEAQDVLKKAMDRCTQVYVVIPYLYPQHGDENPYEEHLQPDLTDVLIKQLYNLRLLGRDDMKGVYVK